MVPPTLGNLVHRMVAVRNEMLQLHMDRNLTLSVTDLEDLDLNHIVAEKQISHLSEVGRLYIESFSTVCDQILQGHEVTVSFNMKKHNKDTFGVPPKRTNTTEYTTGVESRVMTLEDLPPAPARIISKLEGGQLQTAEIRNKIYRKCIRSKLRPSRRNTTILWHANESDGGLLPTDEFVIDWDNLHRTPPSVAVINYRTEQLHVLCRKCGRR